MNLIDSLNKVLEVVIAFNSEKNYFDLLNVILNKMMEMTNADAGTLYVIEDNQLHFRIVKNISLNKFQDARDKIDLPPILLNENNIENISAYTAIKNEMVSVDDVYTDEHFNFSGPKSYDKITGYRTQSMLVLPLSSTDGDVIGVIQLINAMDESGTIISFSDVYDLSIILALASISANALANILYAKEIDELFKSFVQVMTAAIDERSTYSVNHTNNMARFCALFADYLGEKFPKGHQLHFDNIRREQLVMAAYLHDVGKIITPLSIMDKADRLGSEYDIIILKFEIKKQQLENSYLKNQLSACEYEIEKTKLDEAVTLIKSVNKAGYVPDDLAVRIKDLKDITYLDAEGNAKPILSDSNLAALSIKKGTLTEAERLIMQEHVSITGRLLRKMNFSKRYKSIPAWSAGHHEFLDGSGYPEKLADGEIAVETRILTIADIFDALTADDRPYKRAMPIEKAHSILREMVSEGKLQSELVELFIESRVWENNDLKSSLL